MVKQFRFGTKEVTLEFPAGSIEAGESPLEAAKRELLEETGSVGASIVAIGNCKPNPAFLNNTCYHFLAHGAQINQKQNLDMLEEIELELLPLSTIDQLILDRKINHSLSIATWHFFKYHSSMTGF